MKKLAAIIILLTILFYPNINAQNEFPLDTSFTTQTSYQKELEKYPFIKIVSSKIPNDINLNENIIYDKLGNRDLHLDLFEPKIRDEKLLPVVMIIHGGGWRSGNKKMEWPIAVHLAKSGFVAVTVEYRLSAESKYPAAIHDLKSAIRWIRANSNKYQIDPNKIAVSGSSAGGELAAFLGATGDLKKFEGNGNHKNFSTKINAVIDIDGILDFTHPAESNKDSDPAKPSAGKAWFGHAYKENPELWIEASPMNYITDNMPPILFINSSQDRFHAGRDYVIEKLDAYKIYSEVKTFNNTPHTFWMFHPWFEEVASVMNNFLNKTFNLE